MIDLHTHSNRSDGELSPLELASLAAKSGVTVWALTDHDTIEGLAEAQKAAAEAGINFVPGIELNIDWPTGEFHLLGLCLQSVSDQLLSIIAYLRNERDRRNRKIIQKIAVAGFDVSYNEMEAFLRDGAGSGRLAPHSADGIIGRPHIAGYMVFKRIVKTRQEAFDKYLGKDRPFYDEIAGVKLETAVSAIRGSRGIAVTAHPLSLYTAWGKMEELFLFFKERGVEGVEAWHPAARAVECERLETLAKKTGLFVTAGSDYHGESTRRDRQLGWAAGAPIDDRFWTSELEPAVRRANY
jgi:predicted metal-dependent phosphoesterase TrpH